MKFSIITATYNNEKSIRNTLLSLVEQKSVDFESVVIDGSSKDNTLKEISSIKIKNQLLISEIDNGIYNALNKGINLSTGEIIGFLHSDDTYPHADVLRKVHDCFHSTGADIVYGNLYFLNSTKIKVVRKWKSGLLKANSFSCGWMPPHPTVFVKKNVYQEVGLFNEQYKISGDYDFILRSFMNKNYKIRYLQENIYNMTLGGASSNHLIKFKEDYSIMKKYFNYPLLVIIAKVLRKVPQLIIR